MTTTTPRPTRRTVTVPEASEMLGISVWKGYESIRVTGQLAGVLPLHVGRRVMLPAEPLERVLAGEPVAADEA